MTAVEYHPTYPAQITARRSSPMRAILTIFLIAGMSSPAWAPAIPLFDFVVGDEVVRKGQDKKTCGILVGFYGRLGVESSCLQEKR